MRSKTLQCEKCPTKFCFPSELKKHNDIKHLKLRALECQICGKKYGTRGTLTMHTKVVHLNILPFQCPQCLLKCTSKHLLDTHCQAVHEKQISQHPCRLPCGHRECEAADPGGAAQTWVGRCSHRPSINQRPTSSSSRRDEPRPVRLAMCADGSL